MSNPRVIAGTARGIRLQPVPGDITRPVTDRVKEALFNIIGADVIGSSLLDLFGGTGAIGIEALSRGAAYVRFLDLHRAAITTIQTNLKSTKLADHADVIQTDAFFYLQQIPNYHYDYVYIAPPQYKRLWQKAILLLDQNPDWLTNSAWVIVQIDPVEYEEVPLVNLIQFDQRKYGSTLLVFFTQPDPSNTDYPNDISSPPSSL
ncbi:MAG TPA: 16S rRNA (guanine(966)-N(2))-methyltransferase RsmD [Anaerolineaceae bacterium]|nr:16S rRNA (guanine(966)-N(2))-methyltransferase RsmD [Anaerolineaceae bacterium]